jgi:NAD(P)H-flavin reductase
MNIKNFIGEITNIIDLSSSAKEIKISLNEPMDFLPGNFVNVFFDINGEKLRRAYSISSSLNDKNNITLSVRLSLDGVVTNYIWKNNMIGKKVEIMGPFGLNTVDKMNHNKVYLFAFGVGVSVIKSVADYFSNIKKIDNLVIMTGSRNEDEILYKDYFDDLASKSEKIKVVYVVSKKNEGSTLSEGHIQDFIDNFDFNNSDVYVCGQEKACTELVGKVKLANPNDCNFFIESFH